MINNSKTQLSAASRRIARWGLRLLAALTLALGLTTAFGAAVPAFAAPGIPDPGLTNLPGISGISYPGHSGAHRTLVLLVQFSDQASLGSTANSWVQKFFGPTDSVSHYLKEVSYNAFSLFGGNESHGSENDGVIGWLTIAGTHPSTMAEVLLNQSLTTAGGAAAESIVTKAINAADGYVNFNDYDGNGDGILTIGELELVVVVAGYEGEYGTTCGTTAGKYVWNHRSSLATAVTVDSTRVGTMGYMIAGEKHCSASVAEHEATIGIFAKLIGYNIGYPSMTDSDSSATVRGYGLGQFDLMGTGFFNRKLPNTPEGMCAATSVATCVAGNVNNYKGSSPAHPSAFLKWYMNWVTPERISGSQTVTLAQVETSKRIVQMRENQQGLDWNRDVSISRHDASKQYGWGEYFLMENRQRVGYDAGLPGCGVLIYSVDETVNSSGTVAMNDEAHKLVDLIEADNLAQLDNRSSGNEGDSSDFYPGGSANRTFNSTSSPNSNLYGGRASGVSVTNITNQCLATMSADVAVTNEATLRKVSREESAGSTIVTEGSSTGLDSIQVSINTQPLSQVSVTITDTSATRQIQFATGTDAQISAGYTLVVTNTVTLFFNDTNWTVPQQINFSAVNDTTAEGDHNAIVTFRVESSDLNFNGLLMDKIRVNIVDNDAAVLLTNTDGGIDVKEGDTVGDTFTLVLKTQPTSQVSITMGTNSQLTVSPASLLFTSSNYSSPQTVTIKAVDDAALEGNHTGSVTFSVSSLANNTVADSNYNGIGIIGITTGGSATTAISRVRDNDTRVTIVETGNSTKMKEGGSDTYTLVLTTQPSADVNVSMTVTGQDVGLSPATLTFTSVNYAVPQTVTVTGFRDNFIEGAETFSISHRAYSTDANYQLQGNGATTASLDTVVVRVLDQNGASNGADFDGDGRADHAVYRSTSGQWFVRNSTTAAASVVTWGEARAGTSHEVPVTGDYDGDGKADHALYRPDTAQWFVRQSADQTASVMVWGRAGAGDLAVPGDYDGDGRTDRAVYRPSTAQWFIYLSSTGKVADVVTWGLANAGDVPVPGDYDGDGTADLTVFRPSSAQWFIRKSTDGLAQVTTWGTAVGSGSAHDIPLAADFDADGKTDLTVYKPSTAQWFVLKSATSSVQVNNWGIAGSTDLPMVGDYDADGITELAVYRPSTAQWFIKQSGDAVITVTTWGIGGGTDWPIPAPEYTTDFDPYY